MARIQVTAPQIRGIRSCGWPFSSQPPISEQLQESKHFTVPNHSNIYKSKFSQIHRKGRTPFLICFSDLPPFLTPIVSYLSSPEATRISELTSLPRCGGKAGALLSGVVTEALVSWRQEQPCLLCSIASGQTGHPPPTRTWEN